MAAELSRRTLLVVGSVSTDTIDTGCGSATVIGGAGLYASLGAAAAGTANVRLVGVVGRPVVGMARRALSAAGVASGLRPVAGLGPTFTIGYDPQWRATYAIDGVQDELAITHDIVSVAAAGVDGLHLCPTGDPAAQLATAGRLRDELGADLQLSATTFAARIRSHREDVRALWDLVDIWVCDLAELIILADKDSLSAAMRWAVRERGPALVCATDAQRGGYLIADNDIVAVPAHPARTVDPTGAGESFAGAFAVATLTGREPHDAARIAAAVASLTVEAFGSARLHRPPVGEITRRAAALQGTPSPMTAAGRG